MADISTQASMDFMIRPLSILRVINSTRSAALVIAHSFRRFEMRHCFRVPTHTRVTSMKIPLQNLLSRYITQSIKGLDCQGVRLSMPLQEFYREIFVDDNGFLNR